MMFKKVTVSKKSSYKQSVSYKEKMPYQTRLRNADATDLRDNAKIIELNNGFAKVVPKKNRKMK